MTPTSLPAANSSVDPNRLRVSVMVGTSAPSAMSSVAGTRLLS